MPLDDTWLRSVVFILDKVHGKPIGTGFIVVVSNEANDALRPHKSHAYVVTAAHVVLKNRAAGAMRMRTVGGTPHDFPLGTWTTSDDDDVSAQECDFFELDPSVEFNAYPLDEAIDKNPLEEMRLGEQCYFVGLLERVPKMGDSMMPVVRSGSLGAYMQEEVPIEVDPLKTITAHLIDSRSLGGFSGSPCFVQIIRWIEREGSGEGPKPTERTRLIGIVVAHYDDIERKAGVSTIKLNTGIAIVLPVERVRALIEGDDLTKERKKQAPEISTEGATLDSIDDELGSIDKTAELMSDLLHVPKDEVED